MKVALVTDRYITGGGLHHIYRLVEGLPEIQFGLFAQPGPAAPQPGNLPNLKMIANNYAPDTVSGWQPDLIHFHHLRPLLRWSLVSRERIPVPRIFTVHGVHLRQYDFQKGIGAKFKKLLRRRLENFAYRCVDHLVVLSESDRAYLNANYSDIPQMSIIPNGISLRGGTRSESGDKAALKKKLGLNPEQFHFLVVSRFHYQKGYDLLLQAIATFRKELSDKNAVFLLAGDGPDKENIERMAGELEIQPLPRFLGNRQDVDCWMQAADCLLLPSRWEGCPLVLFEAGRAGLPVAVADSPGVRDWIRPDDTGILFDPFNRQAFGKSILQILDGKVPLKHLALRWKTEVEEKYDWNQLVRRYAELYKGLLLPSK
ncbi:MAG: hypothetical protein Kow0037_30470 [Calditrichia bacterium]